MKIEGVKGTNFRSWHKVELSLVDIIAAAIIGANGSGKTALIELILWVLFGKSRESLANSVIRLNATDVSGEVVFVARGQRFKVVRARNIKGKAEVSLFREDDSAPDGHLFAGAARQWVPAGGRGMRGTEEAIVEALGVDYDLLTSCSVLLQDEHGKFEKAAPAERLALLRSLLRLDRWEVKAREARARARSLTEAARAAESRVVVGAEDELASLTGLLEAAVVEVTRCEAAVEAAQAQVGVAMEALATARADLVTAERHAAEVDANRTRATELQEKAAASRMEAGDLPAVKTRVEAAAAAAEGLAADKEAVTAAEAALATLRTRVANRAEQATQLAGLVAKRDGLSRQVATAPTDAALAKAEADAGGAEAADAVAKSAHEDLQVIKDAGVALRDARLAAEAEAEPYNLNPPAGRLAKVEAALAAARSALKVHEATANTLDQAPCAQADEWRAEGLDGSCGLAQACPLLANARDAAGEVATLGARIAALETDRTAAAAEVEKAKAALDKAKAARLAHEAKQGEYQTQADHLRDLVAKANAFEAARASLAQLAEQVAERRKLDTELAEATAKVTQLQAQMEDANQLATAERTASGALDAARTAVAKAEGLAAQLDLLREALKRAEEASTRAAELDKEAADLQALVSGSESGPTAARAAVTAATEAQLAAEATVAQAQGAVKAAREAQGAADRKVAHAQAVVDANTKARAEVAEKDAEAVGWTRAMKAFALAPKLLLEEIAIPALEAEANHWLALFSGRGMSVRLKTQVEQQTTEHKRETLEIEVSDQYGPRGYGAFSGGEKVRIGLAVRLGLSRLLGERDGVPVEFLVIDEGDFGALDDEGIEAVRECLAVLQGRFSPLLVVTHIEGIASALPQRISVLAGADGPELVLS